MGSLSGDLPQINKRRLARRLWFFRFRWNERVGSVLQRGPIVLQVAFAVHAFFFELANF